MKIYMLWCYYNSGVRYFVEANDAAEAFRIARQVYDENIDSCQRIEVLKHE